MKFNVRAGMRLLWLVVATVALSWQPHDACNLKVADGLRLSSLMRVQLQTRADND